MDWFLYDNGLCHERAKDVFSKCDQIRICAVIFIQIAGKCDLKIIKVFRKCL